MRNVLRLLPWVLVVFAFAFALATWSDLPAEIPMRLRADGSASRLTERSFWAWFGLPLTALATVGLLSGVRALIPSHPELFNHPEKARYLALPIAYRAPAAAELGTILDATGLLVMIVIIEVQLFLFATAMGRPIGAATPIILITAAMTAPSVLVLMTRVSSAVDSAERRWIAAGRPND